MTIYQEYECTECPTPFGSITKFPSVYDTDLSGNAGKWKTYQSSKETELAPFIFISDAINTGFPACPLPI